MAARRSHVRWGNIRFEVSQSDFVTRGQTLVASGQFQEAVKVCRLGLLGRPTTVEGRIVLGQALLALKRFDEVLAEMRVALDLDHSSIPAQVLKAEALLRKGDHHAAAEVLTKLRPLAGQDPRIAPLLAEVDRGAGRAPMSASHPAVGYLGPNAGDSLTKHYPNHGPEDEITGTDDGHEDTGGSYTRPTSLSTPASRGRSVRQPAVDPERTPPPAVLAVGDRSGTVEVDPDADGIELGGDDDFGDVAAPPRSGAGAPAGPAAARPVARGRAPAPAASPVPAPAAAPRNKPSTRQPAAKAVVPAPARDKPRYELSSVELDAEDLVEIEEPSSSRRPGPGTAVRNAVKMPSGPIDLHAMPAAPSAPLAQPSPYPAPTPASVRPTAVAQAVQPPLAQMLAREPHVMHAPSPPQPYAAPAGYGGPPGPRGPIAAALPTAAAMPMPPAPYGHPHGHPHGQPVGPPPGHGPAPAYGQPQPSAHTLANAARPTMSLSAAQQQSADAVDALFGGDQGQWAQAGGSAGQNYGRATAAAHEPTARPDAIDPRIASELPSSVGGASEGGSAPGSKPLKTGVRKGRSRLAVALWILVGAIVIGGGVFAGFQIRAMRLRKQIAAARDQAVDLAKSDTWHGWSGARDRLAGIAQASSTVDNRAALARARAVLAFEFGDGLTEARSALDKLEGQGGLDAALGRAYVALAQNDPKAARAAADKALELGPNDAAALYVAGQAALVSGDHKAAITNLRSAQEREPRPLYSVALAHAIGQTNAWEDALSAVERALGAMPDHPAALIERALLLAASGQIVPSNAISAEVRATLVKLISEGAKPLADQPRGVSPAQVALAGLALAQVDFALKDPNAALADMVAAASVGADEQRFGEEAIDTLYLLGDLQHARSRSAAALAMWPQSRRARISQAQIAVALGKPAEALDILTRNPEAGALPRGLAVRGLAKLAMDDLDGAKADYDAALKKLPRLELALIGRAWVDLASGDVDEARKRIEPRFNPNGASPALTTVWAAILRASNDPGQRAKAQVLLEKLVGGPATPDVTAAQLELGRVHRDGGEWKEARTAYAEAARGGNLAARLEGGLLQIEDHDPLGGRDTIESLLKDVGPAASASLLLEGARARMLAGDHPGAVTLLDLADKVPNVVRWQADRERGRLALRRGDVPGAAQALGRAIETCGGDVETFVVAADVIQADPKQVQLAQRIKVLATTHLKDRPELLIITGKLALAAENYTDADTAYQAASKLLEKASPRWIAQAHFGLAAISYFKKDDPSAKDQLKVVMEYDPAIYAAYLFAADLAVGGGTDAEYAVALERAQKSVQFNPDFVAGWAMVGTYGAKLNKPKVLEEAITRVSALAPSGEELKALQALRRR